VCWFTRHESSVGCDLLKECLEMRNIYGGLYRNEECESSYLHKVINLNIYFLLCISCFNVSCFWQLLGNFYSLRFLSWISSLHYAMLLVSVHEVQQCTTLLVFLRSCRWLLPVTCDICLIMKFIICLSLASKCSDESTSFHISCY